MAALRTLTLAVALFVATPAAADPLDRWRVEIGEASARFGVPVAWIERVMRAESGGQTMLGGRPITSRAGAMGLMQLMPATWTAMRAAHGLGRNPHDPRDNILAGTAYLRAMYDRFGYPGLFAAYNAGPGRYAAHLASGRALPTETRAYLAQVSGTSSGPSPSFSQQPPPALFIALRASHEPVTSSPPRAPDESPDALFAIRAPR
ncbi:lytic transglycosylase domain-containing protein [Sphingobium yanoikuyae]|uniref:lytic transglycosylase domain-containing protein n=1 Tax=Sphingobium yanoikuyae TaxID=13690 RepID=UPI00241F50DC|nr:lytic transglycosylase domain-containing protein [Sphingobium yanoikuyae]